MPVKSVWSRWWRCYDGRDFSCWIASFMTPHLRQFGAVTIPREDYQDILAAACLVQWGAGFLAPLFRRGN